MCCILICVNFEILYKTYMGAHIYIIFYLFCSPQDPIIISMYEG